ncbi:hypothetical protein RB599_011007 [Gaeumannomyces hyphopodioides]
MDRRRRRERHTWSTFELNAAVALICKGKHKVRPSSNSGFAVELNKALNSQRANFHEGDIDEDDIENLLQFLLTENKSAVAFAERTMPACITRSKRMAFKRRIDFTGTAAEWVDGGRRDAVMARKPGQRRRAALPPLRTKSGPGVDGSSDGDDEAERPDGLEIGELRERGPQEPMVLNLPSLREAIGDVYHTSNPGNSHPWNTQGSNITLPSLRDQPWAGYGGGGGGQPPLQERDLNRVTETLPDWTAVVTGNARGGLGGGTQQGLMSRLGDSHVAAAAVAGATYSSPYMSVNSDGRIGSRHSTAPSPSFQDVGFGGDATGRGTSTNNNGQRATWGNVMSLPVGRAGYDESSRPGPSGASTYGVQAIQRAYSNTMGNAVGGGWQRDATGGLFGSAPTSGPPVTMGVTSAASHGHGPYSGNRQGLWSSGGTSHLDGVAAHRDQPDRFYDANASGADDGAVPGSSGLDTVDFAQLMALPNAAAGPSSSSAEWGGGAQYNSGSHRHLGVTNTEAQQLQYKTGGRYGSSGTTTVSGGGASAASGIGSDGLYPAATYADPPVGAAAAGPSGGNVAEASSSTGAMAQGGGWRPVTGAGDSTVGEEQQENAMPVPYAVPPQQR